MLEGIAAAFFTLLMVILILFLTWACTRALGKGISLKGFTEGSRHIKMIERVGLGSDVFLALVNVSGQIYLLGVTSEKIQVLASFSGEELKELPQEEPGEEKMLRFQDILRHLGAGKEKSDGLR